MPAYDYVAGHNKKAWNKLVDEGNEWTRPVSSEIVERARGGHWSVLLTPTKPVPRDWFPDDLRGVDVLCLACGGGQQGPVFAAAGASVTVYDNSPNQLAQDRLVADRDGLHIRTVEGDMRDLSSLADGSFDLIFHPVSNIFVPDIEPVWREAYRVLRPGGTMLAGFENPFVFIFDLDKLDAGIMEVKNRLPYGPTDGLNEQEIQQFLAKGLTLEFSHTLEEQIGGQIKAGFVIDGFYEDEDPDCVLRHHTATFIATRSRKVLGRQS